MFYNMSIKALSQCFLKYLYSLLTNLKVGSGSVILFPIVKMLTLVFGSRTIIHFLLLNLKKVDCF